MFRFVWWILVGLAIGALARFILPGENPMGWVATLILGIAGSILGGFLGSFFFGSPNDNGFATGGFVISLLGAILLLLIWRTIRSRMMIG
jgi:uncharacterized membrane protein YeaQ/YmgE (transglycosylase-associated protein family)